MTRGLSPFDIAFGTEPEGPPSDAEAFARTVIFAICHASVAPVFGRRLYERCLIALTTGSTARLGFRHSGKAEAVDAIWRDRHRLYREYAASRDKGAFLATLPWIGPVTRRALGQRLGLDAASGRAAA
ncbi:MAG TPA: hypothetical protein VIL09_07705 [Microvirga sp.]|jgi:hypothetical protein